MSEFSARSFPLVYRDLGIDTNRMGCVMLDVVKIPDAYVPSEEFGFRDPSMPYVRGFDAAKTPHVTLLYGLLESGPNWAHLIDDVLADWQEPQMLRVDRMEIFSTPDAVPYAPLVLRLDADSHAAVEEAHQRLQLLPHINTFPGYKSHITVGYYRKDGLDPIFLSGDFQVPVDLELEVSSLNYGD